MKTPLPFLFAVGLTFAGCAASRHTARQEDAVFEGGCYNPVPGFNRFVVERVTREEVENLMGSEAKRITSAKTLKATARSPITPENMTLFRRYHSATIASMECDNQVVAFFDDTDHIIGYQAM